MNRPIDEPSFDEQSFDEQPILLHGSETWSITSVMETSINSFATSCYDTCSVSKDGSCHECCGAGTSEEASVFSCGDGKAAGLAGTRPAIGEIHLPKQICLVLAGAWQEKKGKTEASVS